MESFILNLASGWTILDLTIMFILLLIAYSLYKKVQAKENLLKFADIERKQAKEENSRISHFFDIERRLNTDELKIAYERIEALNNGNKTLIESRDYWKQRALHKKHTSKNVVDSDNWKCISKHYLAFDKDITYKKDLSQTSLSDNLLYLICDDERPYLVEKKYFQPVN